ncbi:MAG: glycosyltransferase family 1 protein [Planctomycetota bacterium]
MNARFLTRPITGAQRYAIEIARQMRRLDPAVRFLAPRGICHPELAEELGVEVVGRRSGVAWEQLDLPRALRRLGRPVLIGMSFTAPLRYAPSIITVHDVCFTRREWVSRGFYHYYNFIVPRLCRRAARVVTVSEFSKSEIVAVLGVPEDKIDVVYNAVSPEMVEHGAAAPANARGDYVLGAATLQPRKNFPALVRAFRRLDDTGLRLVIAGSVDPKVYGRDPSMRGLFDDPRVELAGYVSDAELAALYRHARVFVYPSLYEGFGIPPIEAMSLGCPVITSNVASLPEVCGDAAHYVDPHDDGAIAAAIAQVIGDPAYRQALVAKGLARVKRYDWRRSAERFLEIAASAVD